MNKILLVKISCIAHLLYAVFSFIMLSLASIDGWLTIVYATVGIICLFICFDYHREWVIYEFIDGVAKEMERESKLGKQ